MFHTQTNQTERRYGFSFFFFHFQWLVGVESLRGTNSCGGLDYE